MSNRKKQEHLDEIDARRGVAPVAVERGRPGLERFYADNPRSKTSRDLPYKDVPKYQRETKSKYATAEGSFPVGKATVTLGGDYSETDLRESLPGNKVGIPDNLNKMIQKTISGGLGYQVSPDLKVSGFIDRSKFKGGPKASNRYTVQLSGKMLGGNFVGSISGSEGEKVGQFQLRIPFASGGIVRPRGRKADY